MKQAYQEFNFKHDTMVLILQADQIIREYQKEGFVLTLRQLYYQFVARDLIENSQRSYKRLGKIISNARLAGLIDWDAIEDRTRSLASLAHWSSPTEIVEACANQYRRDLWEDQPIRVEVWIEKEALAGVIARPCRRLDIPYFSCRGYVSQSEQRVSGLRALQHFEDGQETVILHLGDHDPSGIDMTRDNSDRLNLFTEWDNCVTVKRIALNWDQIEELQPPPNPAKFTDSRIGGYVAKYGYQSWELDALDPKYIENLINEEVSRYVDEDKMEAAKARQEEERQVLLDLAQRAAREADGE